MWCLSSWCIGSRPEWFTNRCNGSRKTNGFLGCRRGHEFTQCHAPVAVNIGFSVQFFRLVDRCPGGLCQLFNGQGTAPVLIRSDEMLSCTHEFLFLDGNHGFGLNGWRCRFRCQFHVKGTGERILRCTLGLFLVLKVHSVHGRFGCRDIREGHGRTRWSRWGR